MSEMSTQAERMKVYRAASERLKLIREKHNLTQRQLSCLAGLAVNTVYTVEKNKSAMTVITAMSLCNVLNCEPEYLLFGITPA